MAARHDYRQLEANMHDPASPWLDVDGAAAHLAMSEHAIRHLIKRQQIPYKRTPNGRIRFDRAELDQWVRGDAD